MHRKVLYCDLVCKILGCCIIYSDSAINVQLPGSLKVRIVPVKNRLLQELFFCYSISMAGRFLLSSGMR